MIYYFEIGQVFCPTGWSWGYADDKNCSRRIAAVDCFNLPITECKPGQALATWPSYVNATSAAEFLPKGTDICEQGKRAKKPILWVYGQYFMYLFRVTPDLQAIVDKDVHNVMNILQQASSKVRVALKEEIGKDITCLTAALHVRTGASLDFGRHGLDGSAQVHELKLMNERLFHSNQRICSVYVATNNPFVTIFANVTNTHPTLMHGMYFLLMPRFLGDPYVDMMEQIPGLRKQKDFDPQHLYLEYLMDVNIMSRVSIYLGSLSTYIMPIAGLRAIYHPEYPRNWTCYFDTRYVQNFHKVCEGEQTFNDLPVWEGVRGGSVYF